MEHKSVLLKETISLLNIKEDGIYVDVTLGRGGTSSNILSHLKEGYLYSFDRDEEAIKESLPKLNAIGDNFEIIHANFASLKEELASRNISKVDGIVADLGVSSPQFDEGYRGFSYKQDAILDMRMDEREKKTAKDIVNNYSFEELTKIFRLYGEDKDASKVASLIVKKRAIKPIETTFELVDIIKEAKPKKELLKKGHPAKQIFQALRIETNGELDALKKLLEDAPSLLKEGGRLIIITFHSLEDRLVKEKIRELTVVEGDRNGPDLYPNEIKKAEFINLTKGGLAPSKEEIEDNPRAHSARLRVIERRTTKGEKLL